MREDFRLDGASAFITGAGSGMGRATALLLAEVGASVIAADVDEDEANHTVKLVEEKGGDALAVRTDVRDFPGVEAAAAAGLERFGHIDVLVNAAGLMRIFQPLTKTDPADWAIEIDVNLMGMLHCCRAVLPGMVEQGRGAVVNISSEAGRVGEARGVVYSAAKAGVLGATRALAKEVGRHGIRVNAICPGGTKTRFNEGLGMEWTPEAEAKAAKYYPLGRLGEAQDIANAILYLVAPASSWVTGQTLSVSGGYTTV